LYPAGGAKYSSPKSLEKRKNWLPIGNFYATLKITRNNEEKCGNMGAAARDDGCEENGHGAEYAVFEKAGP
jgi:hypothetical protein